MSVPRPPTAPAPLGRFGSVSRSQFDDLGPGPRHQFQMPPYEPNYRHNPNARPGFGPGQTQRPHSYHPQIHQEAPPHPNGAQARASVGRSFSSEMGPGAGQRVNPIVIQGLPPPITRYVCFQKKPNNRPWKNEWETCDHITMSIGPEETEKQIRKHDEPGKDIGTCISKLGKYQLRHLRKQEDKLNASEKDPKGFKWVVSAVGKEKKASGGASQTFWAIYSRQSRFRPTTAPGRAPLPRAQVFPQPNDRPFPLHSEKPYDGPIVVQSVEIPAPPRPEAYLSRMGQAGTSFGPLGPQLRDVDPVRQSFQQFPGPGPQIREVDSGSGRPVSFSQFQTSHPADSFTRSSTRAPPAVDAQNFGYQRPHTAEPRSSMPEVSGHRPQSNRVDQPFQPETKRSPRHADVRPAIKQQYQRPAPPLQQQDQRRKRSNSMSAPRVRPDSHYQDHIGARKSRHSTLELPDYLEDKMGRTDRWLESSISGSSGLGTSTVGSGDGGSVVGEYTLNPPPMGRRRNSISTYAGKEYYPNSSSGGIARGRSTNEGARNRRSIVSEYYVDSKPVTSTRRVTQEYDVQFAANPRGRPSPKYVGYHGVGRMRSLSRRRSRSRHHGGREGREGYDSDSEDYEYESVDEMEEEMKNVHLSNPVQRRGPSRPQYRRYRGLVEYGSGR